jgi:hypothetical protein
MINKFLLSFPEGDIIILTRKDKDGKTQLGGNFRFKGTMSEVIDKVFRVTDFEEKKTSYNKIVYVFKTKQASFDKAVANLSELGIVCKRIEKIERMIR